MGFAILKVSLISLLFILINAFFVAAEMALARVRGTRIDQLAEENDKAAKLVQTHLDNPERFISACQLGITLSTLALGAWGEAIFAQQITAQVTRLGMGAWTAEVLKMSQYGCYVFAFAMVAFVQTVLGELFRRPGRFNARSV